MYGVVPPVINKVSAPSFDIDVVGDDNVRHSTPKSNRVNGSHSFFNTYTMVGVGVGIIIKYRLMLDNLMCKTKLFLLQEHIL